MLLVTHQWYYPSSAAVHQLNGPFTCHTQMIYLSSIVVHKMMVHLLVTHQWFMQVVQQSTNWWSIYLSHTNDLSLYCSSLQKDGPITCHTRMIYPSSTIVHKMMVHFPVTQQIWIYPCSAVVHRMNDPFTCHKLMIYPSSTAVQKVTVHLLVTHEWFIFVSAAVHKMTVHLLVIHVVQQFKKSWSIYLTCHTPMIYPSSAAVQKVTVHLLVNQVVQQSTTWWFNLLVTHQWFIRFSAAVRKMMFHLLVTHQ